MKTILFSIFHFSILAFGQEMAIIGDKINCINWPVSFTVSNSSDSIFYWFEVKDSLIAIDTTEGELIGYLPQEDVTICVISAEDTAYAALTIYDNGCDCKIFIPNHFTPNGDAFNEYFQPVFNCDVQAVNTFIYDRYGNTVFFSIDLNPLWDGFHYLTGVVQQDDIYPYQIFYIDNHGETKEVRGHVTLLR